MNSLKDRMPQDAQHDRPYRPTILIVDDTPDNIMLLSRLLKDKYHTKVATNGSTALQVAAATPDLDLILLDVMMPGMDGYETCRQLKANPATSDIPVIFVSACSETEDIVAGFDQGAADYIAKPLRLPEVIARVRAQLNFRSASQSSTQQARHLRMIVEGMDEGLMLLGQDGSIQYANPASERCLGYSGAELAGRHLAALLAKPAANDYAAYFDRQGRNEPGILERCRGTREVLL